MKTASLVGYACIIVGLLLATNIIPLSSVAQPQLCVVCWYEYDVPGPYSGQELTIGGYAYVSNDTFGRAIVGNTVPAVGTS